MKATSEAQEARKSLNAYFDWGWEEGLETLLSGNMEAGKQIGKSGQLRCMTLTRL